MSLLCLWKYKVNYVIQQKTIREDKFNLGMYTPTY